MAQRTGSSGAVQSSDLYDGYGARTGTASPQPDPWGYGARWGYYTDAETGLLLCTHRFYDPAAGRFVTRDPIGYEGGVNLYGYVGNDPVDTVDPGGLEKFRVTNASGSYLIDVPDGQNIDQNVRDAVVFRADGEAPNTDFGNFNPFGNGRRGGYLRDHTKNNTVGDYKDVPTYINPDQNYQLWHERDLGGNFNFGAIGAALGFHLDWLFAAATYAHFIDTKKYHGLGCALKHWRHPADEQQAIEDGYNWYIRHYRSH